MIKLLADYKVNMERGGSPPVTRDVKNKEVPDFLIKTDSISTRAALRAKLF